MTFAKILPTPFGMKLEVAVVLTLVTFSDVPLLSLYHKRQYGLQILPIVLRPTYPFRIQLEVSVVSVTFMLPFANLLTHPARIKPDVGFHRLFCFFLVKKMRGAGGWKEEAQTSGWVDQPGDYLNLLTFSATTPTRLRSARICLPTS